MSIRKKAAILGCGHGGMALAADLKMKGAEVAIWAHPQHANCFNHIKSAKCIALKEDNDIKNIPIDYVSHDIKTVLEFADVIYNCTPMPAHSYIFDVTTQNVSNKEKIFINTSGVFSSVDQFIQAEKLYNFDKLKIFDTSSFPYACRATINSNQVDILGRKSVLHIAPLFGADKTILEEIPECVVPGEFSILKNTLQLGLTGTNSIFHPVVVLFNARLIDNGEVFKFYREGVSKRTSLLFDALDEERLRLGAEMGYKLCKGIEDDNVYYGTEFSDWYEFSIKSDVHKEVMSPQKLNHRFVTEDIAYGLVPLLSLGKIYGLSLRMMESIVNIFSTIMGVNYLQHGRNFPGLTKTMIKKLSS